MVLMGTYQVPSVQYLSTACPYLPRHPIGALADVGSLNWMLHAENLAFHFQDNLQSIILYRCWTLDVNEYLPPEFIHVTDTDGEQRLTSCLTESSHVLHDRSKASPSQRAF
jgi:hypothetical protein